MMGHIWLIKILSQPTCRGRWDLWRLRPSRHQASQAAREKNQDAATGEKLSIFFLSKVYPYIQNWMYDNSTFCKQTENTFFKV